jgi:hypothetical protein
MYDDCMSEALRKRQASSSQNIEKELKELIAAQGLKSM